MDPLISIEAFRTVVDSGGFKHGLRPETQNRTDLNASCQSIHRTARHAAAQVAQVSPHDAVRRQSESWPFGLHVDTRKQTPVQW
jgi:hypothetical protein